MGLFARQELSLLDKPNEKRTADSSSSGQTPLAGWFNRLLQCGKSDHETKSNGSHGGLGCLSVNTSIVGNFHPTPAIEMLQGVRGDHGCQAKARLMFCTGTPIQPHDAFVDAEGNPQPLEWHRIPKGVIAHLQLSSILESPRSFMDFYKGSDEGMMSQDLFDHSDMEGDGPDHMEYIPNLNGFEHELPDGVQTHLRMALVGGVYIPQWALANRRVAMPEDLDIERAAERLVQKCAQVPHRVIDLSPQAQSEFVGYQTLYNIRVKVARDACDADSAAEFGTSPWKLGMIAASLYLWDIMWGAIVPPFKETPWVLQAEHLERAFQLMEILELTRDSFRHKAGAVVGAGAAEDLEDAPEAARHSGQDHDLPDVASVEGHLGSAIARRILSKATQMPESDTWVVKARSAFALFRQKGSEGKGKITLPIWRSICKAAPPAMGTYDQTADHFTFTIPPDSDPAALAFERFANVKPSELLRILSREGGRQRGGRRVRGGASQLGPVS